MRENSETKGWRYVLEVRLIVEHVDCDTQEAPA